MKNIESVVIPPWQTLKRGVRWSTDECSIYRAECFNVIMKAPHPAKKQLENRGSHFRTWASFFNLKNKEQYDLQPNTTQVWQHHATMVTSLANTISVQTILDPPSNNYDSAEAVTGNLIPFGFYVC